MTGKSRRRWARAATSGTTPPKRACRSVCEAMTLERTTGSSVNTAAAVSSQEVSIARKCIGTLTRDGLFFPPLAALGCGGGCALGLLPAGALAEEGQRVVIDHPADGVLGV